MKKIPSVVEFNGLSIRFDRWISLFENQSPFNVKKVGFKRDLRYWNDSPWSLQPQKAIHLTKWSREGTVDLGVYQIWERKDGMGIEIEFFETFEEYDQYSPSDDMPHSIKNEIGLCQNYHKGV